MTLFLSNADVAKVLTVDDTIAALEASYRGLGTADTVCRPRIDIRIPTSVEGREYQWGTMEGGSTGGYFAIRMKSDVISERATERGVTEEKYCVKPGLYCGLVFLTSIENGEPLALVNDGVLQHMRVGADGAIGVKHLAREDVRVVGMLGSGGMAHSHVEAFLRVRPGIERLQVFSPTPAHREAFAAEMAAVHGIEAVACDTPEAVYENADLVAALTNSKVPVLDGTRLAPGTHVINIGGGGVPDAATLDRIDVYLRFGSTPAPAGRPELALHDEHLTWQARPDRARGRVRKSGKRGHGILPPERMVTLAELLDGTRAGRTTREQVTYSERGNLQGAQFFAVAARVYERAKAAGLGREIPTEWFLQDIRD